MLRLAFPLLDGTTRRLSHVTLGCIVSSPIGLVLSLVVSFFGKLSTWGKVFFASNKHSFRYHANTSALMRGSTDKHLVINSFYHNCNLFILNPLFISLRIHFGLPHPTIAHLSQCQCGHTIDDLSTHLF
jgi:hypothetical protein